MRQHMRSRFGQDSALVWSNGMRRIASRHGSRSEALNDLHGDYQVDET